VIIGDGSIIEKNIPNNTTIKRSQGIVINPLSKQHKFDCYIIGAGGLGREIESWVCRSKEFNNHNIVKGI